MTEFIEFCREYGVYCLTFLCFVIEIVLIIIKRKPKTVDDFLLALNEVRTKLPELISKVECPGNGEVKKNKVMEIAEKALTKSISRGLSDKEFAAVRKILSDDIEAILSTPTKKEIL